MQKNHYTMFFMLSRPPFVTMLALFFTHFDVIETLMEELNFRYQMKMHFSLIIKSSDDVIFCEKNE